MIASEDDILLAIDTATPVASVALTKGDRVSGQILSCLSFSSSVTHSRRLLKMIESMLAEANVDKSAIKGIAVGLGPGSFTGLRIGLATAKGLATALAIPLYGASSLDMLAANCTTDRLICAVVDARKKEVYTAFYRSEDRGFPVRVSAMAVVTPAVLGGYLQEPVVMIGDALQSYGALWQSMAGDFISRAPSQLLSPSAATLGLLAGEQRLMGKSLDIAAAVPIYVRSSDAELNLQIKTGQFSNSLPEKSI